MSPERGPGLVEANKEGLGSLLGYCALHWWGASAAALLDASVQPALRRAVRRPVGQGEHEAASSAGQKGGGDGDAAGLRSGMPAGAGAATSPGGPLRRGQRRDVEGLRGGHGGGSEGPAGPPSGAGAAAAAAAAAAEGRREGRGADATVGDGGGAVEHFYKDGVVGMRPLTLLPAEDGGPDGGRGVGGVRWLWLWLAGLAAVVAVLWAAAAAVHLQVEPASRRWVGCWGGGGVSRPTAMHRA